MTLGSLGIGDGAFRSIAGVALVGPGMGTAGAIAARLRSSAIGVGGTLFARCRVLARRVIAFRSSRWRTQSIR